MIFIVEVDGEGVGLIEAYVHQTEDDPSLVPMCYMEVQSLMVLKQHRRNGIAHGLMAQAREWAKAKGATEITLGVWEANESARDFYQHMGFTTAHRRMTMPL